MPVRGWQPGYEQQPLTIHGSREPPLGKCTMGSSELAQLGASAPFFIVRDVPVSVAFYRDLLGFDVLVATPETEPFVAMLGRGGARVILKSILPEVQAVPNPTRHPWAKWDAFVHVPDPDALAAELTTRAVPFNAPLSDTDDRLR